MNGPLKRFLTGGEAAAVQITAPRHPQLGGRSIIADELRAARAAEESGAPLSLPSPRTQPVMPPFALTFRHNGILRVLNARLAQAPTISPEHTARILKATEDYLTVVKPLLGEVGDNFTVAFSRCEDETVPNAEALAAVSQAVSAEASKLLAGGQAGEVEKSREGD